MIIRSQFHGSTLFNVLLFVFSCQLVFCIASLILLYFDTFSMCRMNSLDMHAKGPAQGFEMTSLNQLIDYLFFVDLSEAIHSIVYSAVYIGV